MKLTSIRQELPAVQRLAYLNTGSIGPLPRRAAQAIAAEAERQLLEGRVHSKQFIEESPRFLTALRARFARLLSADADEIALTRNTTEGMNIAVWGINWRMGDEIITTRTEHEGGYLPVYAAARRFGLSLRVVDIGERADPTALLAALTPRARLVVVSHVQWKTGAILPLAEVAQAAHRVGAWVAVDGAQSAGAIPIDVRASDVDFYAVSGQKWLCGPEGTGALYVRRERLSELAPTYVGYSTLAPYPAADNAGYFLPAPGAKRFECGTVYWPALYGLNESLRWLEEEVGYEWVFAQRRAVTERCREILAETPGVTIHSPPHEAGLTVFSVAGLEPMAASDALAEMGVMIRSVRDPDRLRVSTGFFNNEEDVFRLRDGLLKLRTKI